MDQHSKEVQGSHNYSNYVGDKARNTIIAFTAIHVVFVFLRYFSQKLRRRLFDNWEDWLMFLALIFCLSINVVAIVALKTAGIDGTLEHAIIHHRHAVAHWYKLRMALTIQFPVSCFIPRLVILILYRRVFVVKAARWACWVLLVFLSSYTVAAIIVNTVLCVPYQKIWIPTLSGSCMNESLLTTILPLPNLVIDFAMVIFPVSFVAQLQMTRRNKLALQATFAMVSVGGITSLTWFIYLLHKANVHGDMKATVAIFLCWCVSEPACYLMAACLPSYRPLVDFVLQRLRIDESNHVEDGAWWAGSPSGDAGFMGGGGSIETTTGTFQLKNLVPGWMRKRLGGNSGTQGYPTTQGQAQHSANNRSGGMPVSYELTRRN